MISLYENPILTAIYARAREAQTRNKIAIREVGGKSITYQELARSIEAVAVGLTGRGFQRGDRVLFLVRPRIDLMIAALAVVRAGGVLVFADPGMGKAVFEERMRLAAPRWVFAESAFLAVQHAPLVRAFLKRRGVELPELQQMAIPNVVNVGAIPIPGALAMNTLKRTHTAGEITERPCEASDDVTIVFTSGTTGKPKGVVHTVGSMLATIARINEYLTFAPDDVIYDTGILLLLPALMLGASTVLGTGKLSAESTVKAYQRYRVTKTIDAPAHVEAMMQYLASVGGKFPDSLRDFMLGAAPVLSDFLRKLRTYCPPPTRIWSIYGMTELLPAAFVQIDEKLDFDARQGDLVGLPMRGISVKIAPDGELLISGEGLFDRYLGDAPVTQHPTGDLACLDECGRVVLLGRKKDMIIRGHDNIYPSLYEPTIRQIPGVADAAMVGVYQADKSDEEVVLFIEPQPYERDLDGLNKRIRQALISGQYSIDLSAQPDYIFFEKIPYGGRSQKLDKKRLRRIAEHRLRELANEKT